jgi:hypothetical protein
MARSGYWTFIDRSNGTSTKRFVSNSDNSTIKAAFDAAKVTLTAQNNSFYGYDPSGREYKYVGVQLGKKFDR